MIEDRSAGISLALGGTLSPYGATYGPGRSIVAAGTAVPAARFTPRLRVALRFAQVPTGHTLPSVATLAAATIRPPTRANGLPADRQTGRTSTQNICLRHSTTAAAELKISEIPSTIQKPKGDCWKGTGVFIPQREASRVGTESTTVTLVRIFMTVF